MTTITDRIPAITSRVNRLAERLSALAERYPATRATYARTAGVYLVVMAAWTYGFANQSRDLPTPLVGALLLAPLFLHAWAGFAIGRHEALYLACWPPLLALVGPGLSTVLAVTLVLLMIFPGAPLLFVGVFGRQRVEDDEFEDWF